MLTVLYFTPNIFDTTPLSPPCHPERSGTTNQYSRAPTNHRRTANPAPSGAPAGGISVAERCYMKQRTPRKSLPLEEKSYCGGWLRYVVPLADFALIRRFATPSPPGGRLLRRFLVVRDSADFLVRLRSRTEKIRTAKGSLPPGGEGGAKRRMRAKQANAAHNAPSPHPPLPKIQSK